MSEPRIAVENGHTSLLLDGAVQSIAPGGEADGYWPLLLPPDRPRSALLLGLGGGTVARLLIERFGPLPTVGVDDDSRVLDLARAQGWLDLPGLTVIQADARAYAADRAARGERFALIVVDLFRDGAVPSWVCGRRFLALLARIVAPDGVVAFNLSRGQGHAGRLRRLARRFTLDRIAATGMNMVVHARPRPRRRYRLLTRARRTSPRQRSAAPARRSA